MAEFDWYGWSGAAGGAVIASYLGAKVRPFIGQMGNANLAKYAYIAAQIFQLGRRNNNYTELIDGASEWAVGDLVGGAISNKVLHVTAAPAVTTAHTVTATAAAPATSGATGVPASGGSSAFDLPVPGY